MAPAPSLYFCFPPLVELTNGDAWPARSTAQIGERTASEQNRGKPGSGNSTLGGLLSGAGGGALGAGALGLLLGSKKVRKLGGKALTYGSIAALGVVAYNAYRNWQDSTGATSAEPRTLDRVPQPQVEQHTQAILRSLIGAAKADGHVDERERQLIDGEIAKVTPDPELQHWFDRELDKPLDPADIARAAETPEIAAEMYLASLIMVDEESYMERAYLDELSRQLNLPQGLKQELEKQARQAG